jgi:hypothetical protein
MTRRDPYFGRFAVTVAVIGLVAIVLGLAFIWYFFQAGGTSAQTGPLKNIFTPGSKLPPGQAVLYYTKDGKQLVGTATNIGSSSLTPNDKARLIVTRLIEGKDAAFLKSPIPEATKINSVFVSGRLVIVNLSKEFMNNLKGGVDAELLAVYSIVNSLLTNMESVDAVQLLIEGEKVFTLRGHIDIESPLIANTAITRAS